MIYQRIKRTFAAIKKKNTFSNFVSLNDTNNELVDFFIYLSSFEFFNVNMINHIHIQKFFKVKADKFQLTAKGYENIDY